MQKQLVAKVLLVRTATDVIANALVRVRVGAQAVIMPQVAIPTIHPLEYQG